ncbi:MAG: hypothetical protein ACPK85_00870, partial [Methanosarcina sp.]
LPTEIAKEDDKYIYLKAKTSEYGSFAITAKEAVKEEQNEGDDEGDNGQIENTLNNKTESEDLQENAEENTTETEKDTQQEQPETQENTKMPAFGFTSAVIGIFTVLLCKKKIKI